MACAIHNYRGCLYVVGHSQNLSFLMLLASFFMYRTGEKKSSKRNFTFTLSVPLQFLTPALSLSLSLKKRFYGLIEVAASSRNKQKEFGKPPVV